MANKIKPPKRGTFLDYEALRAETERVCDAYPGTLEALAAEVLAASGERETLSRAAISGAKNTAGGSVARLQLDILATLTGATFSGPGYRVD